MCGTPGTDIRGLDRGGERTAGGGIGSQNQLVRIRDRRRLGHEVHAADHQHRRVELGRAAGHLERVGHEVGEVLDLGDLIVVREDGGAAGGTQLVDLGDEIAWSRCRGGDAHRYSSHCCGAEAEGPIG